LVVHDNGLCRLVFDITIYVAIKGGADIKHMLARLDVIKAREVSEGKEG